ncbi:MAG: protein-ADP-ribose hydrolase [Oscillospiraceae bacterium]|nr:protein-ADP-ribose hydrolase [Oscillospiraceae bacterium]
MTEKTEQNNRLDYLVEAFKEDSVEYRDIPTPEDTDGKRRLLRSLMNIRMPGQMDEEILKVQDLYLRGRNAEKGIVRLEEIPTVKEKGSTHRFGDIISIWQGDITRLDCDAIVNAANSEMLGCFVPMHTCIDNCIHTYAGIQLRQECARQMAALRRKYGQSYEQPTAVPMLTDAYNLPAKKIVHIVGPIVQTAVTDNLKSDLADCYGHTLEMCKEAGLRSVAFCCISTGVFRFPNELASGIAVDTVTQWLEANPEGMDRIIFNVFKDEDRRYYEQRLS